MDRVRPSSASKSSAIVTGIARSCRAESTTVASSTSIRAAPSSVSRSSSPAVRAASESFQLSTSGRASSRANAAARRCSRLGALLSICMQCPTCNLPLEPETVGGQMFDRCGGCGVRLSHVNPAPQTRRFPAYGYWQSPPLGEALLSLEQKHWEVWREYHATPPDELFHYTSAEGFLGILATGRLWAARVEYLNDATEFGYGTSLLQEVLEKKKTEVPPGWKSEFLTRCLRGIPDAWCTYFVACFCTDGDLLSQWRGYGSRGGGYAVGFQARRLGTGGAQEVCLRRVLYEREQQRPLVEALVDDCLKALRRCRTRKGRRSGPTSLRLPQRSGQRIHDLVQGPRIR